MYFPCFTSLPKVMLQLCITQNILTTEGESSLGADFLSWSYAIWRWASKVDNLELLLLQTP